MSTKQTKIDLFNYTRRETPAVKVGVLTLGSGNPIRVQSMTNTSTMDTPGSVAQILRIVERGGELVRLTTQGSREAINLGAIKKAVEDAGCNTPLVADVHFNASVADVAAQYADKVRVNPGNYVDTARTFKHIEYTDEEYAAELERLAERFTTFLNLCKKEGKAIRVGVNHGSLSDRIMSRYGDTPEGVVESCMEFLRICNREKFGNVVVSIKTSNTPIMVTTVRLLCKVMEEEGIVYPLHLGVTEAGDAEDGRIKSAVGIGALLADGIGDTLRVSLAEAPENEIPVAKELVDYITRREGHARIDGTTPPAFDYINPVQRNSRSVLTVGGGNVPVVISEPFEGDNSDLAPDFTVTGDSLVSVSGAYPLTAVSNIAEVSADEPHFVRVEYNDLTPVVIENLKKRRDCIIVAYSNHVNPVGELRALVHKLTISDVAAPVVIYRRYDEQSIESLRIKAAADLGDRKSVV